MKANRTSVAELARPATGAFFHWESPGEPVAVHFHLNVIDLLEREVLRSGSNGAAGILLGRFEKGRTPTLIVEDCETIPWALSDASASSSPHLDSEALAAVLERWRPISGKRISVLGFYRGAGPSQATVNDDDLAILNLNSHLASAEQIFLMIERRAGRPCNGSLCMVRDGVPVWQWNTVSFNRKELGGRVPAPYPMTSNLQKTSLRPAEGRLDEEPAPRQKTEKRPTTVSNLRQMAAAFAAATLVCGVGFLFLRDARGFGATSNGSRSGDSSTLGLKVDHRGSDLQLSWDRNAPALRNATAGRLLVTDGSIQRTLDLDLDELRSGSILYTPMSDNAVLRLDVVGEGSASESVRVVSGILPTLPASSGPAAAPRGAGPTPPGAADASSSAASNPKGNAAVPMETSAPQARIGSWSMPRPKTPSRGASIAASPNPAAPEIAMGTLPPAVEVSLGAPTAPRAADAGGKFEPARLKSGKEPTWPTLAPANRSAGTNAVEVTFRVSAKGVVGKVTIVKGSPAFAQQVVDAVRTRVYDPAKLNGEPVDSELSLAYVFKPS